MTSSKNDRLPRIWFCGGHFINDVYTGMLNPIMPFIAERINISMAVATIILSFSHICSSLLQPLFGFFADKINKRLLIFWGILLSSIFISTAPTVNKVWLMILCIILGSLGSSLFHPQALGWLPKFAKNDLIKYMGIFLACGTLGYSTGPLFSSVIAQYFGLDKMPCLSLLGIFWAFIMFAMVPKLSNQTKVVNNINFKQAIRDILGNRQLNILNLIALLKALVQTSCSILPPFLWKTIGYTKFQIGLALFAFTFAGGIATLLSPKFEKKIGTANVFYISMTLTFPLMIIFMLTYKTLPALSFVIFTCTGFVTMFATPITMSMAQKTLPQYKSIIGGFINGFSWGVVAVLMSITGYIAQATSIVPVLTVISAIPAVCSVFVKKLNFD